MFRALKPERKADTSRGQECAEAFYAFDDNRKVRRFSGILQGWEGFRVEDLGFRVLGLRWACLKHAPDLAGGLFKGGQK